MRYKEIGLMSIWIGSNATGNKCCSPGVWESLVWSVTPDEFWYVCGRRGKDILEIRIYLYWKDDSTDMMD